MSLFSSVFGGNIADDKGCDWYCDKCGEHMNYQPGFTTSSDEWNCTSCGYTNDVSTDNIMYDDEDDDNETLSVYDAALIWASNGKDEDYTFGYSEEELENAL